MAARRSRQFAESDFEGLTVVPVVRESSRWNSANEDECLWWPRVFWIDPGETSGIAVVWFDPVALVAGKPLPRVVLATATSYLHGPEKRQAREFIRIAEALDKTPGLAVGSESFVIGSLNQSEVFLSPVRIRSMLDFYFWTRRRQLWAQSPSDAKTSITDARLQLWEMYVPGPDHIRDALRHTLLWLRRLRMVGEEGMIRWHGNETGWFEDAPEDAEAAVDAASR